MTLTFQPNELERKAKEFFKFYNFQIEKEIGDYKLIKKTFFDLNKTVLGIDVSYFSQSQKDIIYRIYANACEDRLMKNCKKEIVGVLKKYNCYLDTNEHGEMFIGNNCIDSFILI